MRKYALRALAISACALSAGFIGFGPTSALSLDQAPIIVTQAATPANPEPDKSPPVDYVLPYRAGQTPAAQLPAQSPGVAAHCAAMSYSAEREACIAQDHLNRRM